MAESFKRAKSDLEIVNMAEEGLDDSNEQFRFIIMNNCKKLAF
jgi:hypothetical protein